MHVNLLPRAVILRMLVRKRLRQWSLLWAALSLAAIVACAAEYRLVLQQKAELDGLTERCAPLHAMQVETAALQQQRQLLEEEMQALRRVQTRDPTLALLRAVGEAVRLTDRQLQIQRLGIAAGAQVSQAAQSPATSQPAVAPPSASWASLALHGVAGNDAALARFVESLRSAEEFEQVELKSSTQSQSASGEVRQFQVECRFAE